MSIVGKPVGYDEIWIVGDAHLLAQACKGLEILKDVDTFNNNQRKTMPFILQNFEVFVGSFHYSWCFTTQIRGGLNGLLASKWRLPNYIYIMFSNDQVNDADILGDHIYAIINQLLTYVNRRLMERKSKLPKKARRYKKPTVTVIKTVPKFQEKLNENNFKIRRRTFNRVLQKEAMKLGFRSVNIDAILPSIRENFDEKGEELSDKGIELTWQFLSQDIKSMEYPPVNSSTNNKIFNDFRCISSRNI